LSGGQAWWEQILKQIRECDVFILSPESLDSVACKRELSYAMDLGKPILPILVADDVSINLLSPELSKIQFVDYRKQDRKAAIRLAKAISTVSLATPAGSAYFLPRGANTRIEAICYYYDRSKRIFNTIEFKTALNIGQFQHLSF
jgi:hypothetical protein